MVLLQWNIRGFYGNLQYMQLLIKAYKNPLCICLQETKLPNPNNAQVRGYSFIESNLDYDGTTSNTAILVRSDIPFQKLSFPSKIRYTAVRIYSHKKWYTVSSVYLPPNTAINETKLRQFFNISPEAYIVLGDFNGRHSLWCDNICNSRGQLLEKILFDYPVSIMNTEGPTHIDPRTRTETCIDLSLCSNSVMLDFVWRLDRCLHNSDHYPISLTFHEHESYERPMKWFFDGANWNRFSELTTVESTEDIFNNINDMVVYFTTLILNAAIICIRRSNGRIKGKSVPWWNNDCKEAIKEKRKSWQNYRRKKTDANYIDFKKANAKARRVIRLAKKESWRRYVTSINVLTPITTIWKKIHKIAGKYTPNPAPVLHHQGEKIGDPGRVAEILATHFSNISKGEHLSREFLNRKSVEEQTILDFSTDLSLPYNKPFIMKELESSLTKSKSTAEGPDGIHYDMLKHLSSESKDFLLMIYNRIWRSCEFPEWNISWILAFIKPGKNGYQPGDYRPIALTSCMCKLLERMINTRLQWYLESRGSLSPLQFGFRKHRSTTDALVALEIYIREAFAREEFVISIFFDIEKAYDTTWRYHILRELYSEGLRGNLPITIQNFFKDRTFQVRVGNTFSSVHTQYEGVPQGSVLSTTCFILAINRIGQNLPNGVRFSIYVDDYCIYLAGKNVLQVQRILQEAIDISVDWTTKRGFKFSASKTCAVTFSRKHTVPQPQLTLYGQPIPYKDSTKFLGLIFDTRLTFQPYIEQLKVDCTHRLNLLRVLSHTSWGADRKTLERLHSILILSKLDYGCQVYGSASTTNLDKLNVIHNTGLRLATGAFKSSPVESLYVESGFYSLEDRRIKLNLRYAIRIGMKYSAFIHRNVFNNNNQTFFEDHPRFLRPFNVRVNSNFSELDINYNIQTANSYNKEPWQIPSVNFCKDLTLLKKGDFNDAFLCNIFLEHFSEHVDCIPIFTDGSKSEEGVGFAFVYPDKVEKRRLPNESSIFSAELFAILLALQRIFTMQQEYFVIVSDSQSALTAIERFNSSHPIVIEIQEWLFLIFSIHKNVQFCWVPSHVGVPLNESADKEAKSAIRERGVSNKALPYTDYYPIIEQKLKRKWQEKWSAVSDRNKLRKIKSTVCQWPTSFQKNRRWEVVLARLRLGHTRLTHGFLMERMPEPPKCTRCNANLSVEHILVHCTIYSQKRNFWFRHVSQTLTMRTLLEESNNFSIDRVIGFLFDVGILDKI